LTNSQRNGVLVGVVIIALGIVGYLSFGSGRGAAGVPSQYVTSAVCLACQKETEVKHARGELAPWTCRFCGKNAVYPWFYCSNCKKRFVPNLTRPEPGGPLRTPTVPVCPACGSQNVGLYMPGLTDEKPAGDAPLPAWSP
jgi:hypothetical protein